MTLLTNFPCHLACFPELLQPIDQVDMPRWVCKVQHGYGNTHSVMEMGSVGMGMVTIIRHHHIPWTHTVVSWVPMGIFTYISALFILHIKGIFLQCEMSCNINKSAIPGSQIHPISCMSHGGWVPSHTSTLYSFPHPLVSIHLDSKLVFCSA